MTASTYTTKEILLAAPDDRQAAIAIALGGRPTGDGYLMTPKRAEKATELYAAGWHADGLGCFTLPGSSKRWRLSEALAISRLTGKAAAVVSPQP